MKKLGFVKSISILLVISFTFTSSFSIIAYANGASGNACINEMKNTTSNLDKRFSEKSNISRNGTDYLTNSYVPTDNESYTELVDKRELSTKYFLLDSKRYEAVQYGAPVHYLDNGKYKDIDNSLVLEADKGGKSYYTNKANSFKVVFAPSLNEGWSAGISQGDYEMKWRIEGTTTGKNAVASTNLTKNAWNALSKGDQRRNLPNISSQLKYTDALPNMELDYQLISNMIKENITIDSYNAINIIEQKISLKCLKLIQKDDGSIIAVDSSDNSKEIFYLLNPYIIDSEGNESQDITVKLVNVKDIQEDEPTTAEPSESPAPSEPILPSESTEASASPSENIEGAEMPNPSISTTLSKEPVVDSSIKANKEPLFSDATNTYILTYTLDNKWLAAAKYPCIIDPTVTTSMDNSDIRDARICSNLPNTNYGTSYISCTGYGATSGINYTLVRFNNMPEIGSSYVVEHAGYSMKKASTSTVLSYVTVHEITSSWDSQTVTWNTKPSFNSQVDDYQYVGLAAGTTYEWDITRIAKDWYSGTTENGLLFKDTSTTSCYKEWYTSDALYGQLPYCYFVYADFSGIEDFWDYVTGDLDKSGTANVNIYNGNLVYTHIDLAMNGERMPVTITHVFNSTTKDDNDSKMLYGKGWRTNYDQRMTPVTIGEVDYYKYVDEDGTQHYFSLQDDEWQDESGLDITLIITNNVPTITDKQDNVLVFYATNDANKPGFLNYIEDRNGNRQTVGYDGNYRINQITDGAGRVILLTRDENNYLYKIREEVSSGIYRDTTFTYNNSRLSRITYPDDNHTDFTYDGNGNIDYITSFDSRKIDLSYLSSSPYRVTYMDESTATEDGAELSFSYGYNRTELTDSEGRKTKYEFNDYGNTVCVIGPDGSANYAQYGTSPTGGDMSKITTVSKLQKFGKNYLKNSGFESSSYWELGGTDDTATLLFDTSAKYLGAKSAKLVKTQSGDNASVYQIVTLQKGKTYTLSGYIKTSNVSGDDGASVWVGYYNSQDEIVWTGADFITGTTDWHRCFYTFSIPSDATSSEVWIYGNLSEATGTAWFDCFQLEDGSIANRYNIVDNADFDYVTSDMPDNWTASNCGANDKIITTSDSTNPGYMSDNRMEFTGSTSTGKNIIQDLYLSGSAGDCYVAGAWAKARSAPLVDTRAFGLAVWFDYTDQQYTDEWIEFPFSEDTDIWQYICNAVVAEHDYQDIKIKVEYDYNVNTTDFDGIQLFKEEYGNTYTYDSDGNLTSATDTENNIEEFDYNANNDLITYTDARNNEYDYTYDNNHNMLTATSAEGLVYTYTYDAYGNVTSVKVGDSTDYIRSTVNYNGNGNYLDFATDPFGEITDYTYNIYKGTLTSVIDPLSNTINNTYDSDTDMLTGTAMTSGGITVSNSYTYTNDRLTQISHNAPNSSSVDYNIDYNTLGWNTGASVGEQDLATYDLQDHTGRLNSVTYGNGQTLSYTYDAYDRVKKVSQGANDLYSYEYDNSGNIGYMKDYVQDAEYWYEYDSLNRLGRITKTDNSGTSTSQYTFNDINMLSTFNESIEGTGYLTNYSYDDDGRPDTSTFGSYHKSITYNSKLGRPNGYDLKNGVNIIYSTSFGYEDGDGTTSADSTRISSITNGGETLSYTYDERGDITKVEKDANNYSEYRYNAFGELIRENYKWGATSYTMIYSYDVGGNITQKIKYAFVAGDGQVGAAIDTISYSYDNTWKDKLVSYDGESITYDNIGNPTDDGTWEYTWTQGRKLEEITNGNTTANYKYNDNGIRIEKTVDNVTTKYNVIGDLITWERTEDNDPIYYLYDSSDELWGLKYTNGNTYFYVYNAQGDIIKIVNSSGTVVVEYVYDAWGKLMSTTGSMAGTLGADNPFRYRGYYYDKETGLYYLNSRYYNPEWGRFINTDSYVGDTGELFSHNLFAYCRNNPVNQSDPTGRDSYKNYYYNRSYGYYVITIIHIGKKSYTYTYKIKKGSIEFDFKYNSYRRSTEILLARAMYYALKAKGSASGRTISGIRCELNIHFIFYVANPRIRRTRIVNIGSTANDNNAAIFERYAKFSISYKKSLDKILKNWLS